MPNALEFQLALDRVRLLHWTSLHVSGMTKINLSLTSPGTSLGMSHFFALVLKVSPPHLQIIAHTFDANRSTMGGKLDSKILAHDG